MSKFGFTVSKSVQSIDGSGHVWLSQFVVELPPECDEWRITAAYDKSKAIADLEQFIDEAARALTKLKALPE